MPPARQVWVAQGRVCGVLGFEPRQMRFYCYRYIFIHGQVIYHNDSLCNIMQILNIYIVQELPNLKANFLSKQRELNNFLLIFIQILYRVKSNRSSHYILKERDTRSLLSKFSEEHDFSFSNKGFRLKHQFIPGSSTKRISL